MRKAILISIFIAAQLGVAWAQQPPPQNATPSSTIADQTVDEVQANIDELSRALPPPDKDVLLLRELDRIDGEIARATQQFQKANGWKNEQANFNAVIERISRQAKVLAQFDCQNNLAKFQIAALSYNRAYNELLNYSSNLTNVDFQSIAFLPTEKDPAAACNEIKARFSSADYSDAQSQVQGGLQKALSDFLTTQSNLAAAETKYLEALKKRRAVVQDKLNASQPAAQIGNNLWLLLLILGTACVATILGIKLFDTDLQMEWVASGQVIQFVTVMILLSVILALGLSSKLSENTLGTLLGGIAGYVLAQGVGRSAARDVARSAVAAAAGAFGAAPGGPVLPAAPAPAPAAPPAPAPPAAGAAAPVPPAAVAPVPSHGGAGPGP
jgi:hypothetical protein